MTNRPFARNLSGQSRTLKFQLVRSGIIEKGQNNLNFVLLKALPLPQMIKTVFCISCELSGGCFTPQTSYQLGLYPGLAGSLERTPDPSPNRLCLYFSIILATPLNFIYINHLLHQRTDTWSSQIFFYIRELTRGEVKSSSTSENSVTPYQIMVVNQHFNVIFQWSVNNPLQQSMFRT